MTLALVKRSALSRPITSAEHDTNLTAIETATNAVDFTGGATGAVARSLQAKGGDGVSVKDFGAAGDGTTNDTLAFQKAATYINAAGGGTLLIPAGTYIVGSQTFANGTGHAYSYQAAKILEITGCTKPVLVSGYGAVLKLASGLKFGSFNPTTGASFTPGSLPFTTTDYAASVTQGGIINLVSNTGHVTIEGVELDGNMAGITLGGQWGDTGYQLDGDGVHLDGNSRVTVRDVHCHHHAHDGLYVRYTGATDGGGPFPVALYGVRSLTNARQGLSWTGGDALLAADCEFSNTGRGTFSSSPKAGVNVEPSGGELCRRGTFIRCRMDNNAGLGVIADGTNSRDMLFQACYVRGVDAQALWPNAPRWKFVDCEIVGKIVQPYADTNGNDLVIMERCRIHDLDLLGGAVSGKDGTGGNLIDTGTARSLKLIDCTVIAKYQKIGNLRNGIYIGTYFKSMAGTNIITDHDYQALTDNAYVDGCVFDDDYTGNIPTDGYYVGPAAASSLTWGSRPTRVVGSKLRYFTWSPTWGGTGTLLQASTTWDPASLAAATRSAAKVVDVHGCRSGDQVTASFDLGTSGMLLYGEPVPAGDQVNVWLFNPTGASTLDLASGTLRVWVTPAGS